LRKPPLKINNSKTWKSTTLKIAKFHLFGKFENQGGYQKIQIWNLQKNKGGSLNPFKEPKSTILMKKCKLSNTSVNHFSDVKVTKEPHHTFGWLSKLALKQCLLNSISFMKHDNVTKYGAFMWNWSKSAINDDGMFITSCINYVVVDKIC
jgi:hypothetical protein